MVRYAHGTPRRKKSSKGKIGIVLKELTDICSATAASTLVLEIGKKTSSRLAPAERAIAAWAEAQGLRVTCLSTRDACFEVCGAPRLAEAAARIAQRYSVLEQRLYDSRGYYVRSPERWRHLRPLVVAFVLAHAFAARSVIRAFGGETQSHSPFQPYDIRNP